MSKTLLTLSVLLLPAASWAGDWTQFRGPNGQAVAQERGLPASFEQENLRWKASLPGRGLSNPVIAAGRVFVTCSSGYKERRLHVLCLDVKTGKKLWERQFRSTGSTACHPKTNMAAPSPVVEGNAVYCLWACGDLAALDRDGNLLWYRSLVSDYPDVTNQVGMAASPILHKGVLLMPLENAGDSFAAGIDARTGKNLWRVPRTRCINWVTPVVISVQGQDQAIFQTASDVTAYEPTTGKVLWQRTERDTDSIRSPSWADGLLLVAGKEFMALRPKRDGSSPEVVWKSNKMQATYATPVYYQGKVYALTNQSVNAIDGASGKLLWQERVTGPFSASPVVADDKIYVVNEKGRIFVLQTGEQSKILGTGDLDDVILATPAIADGAVFFRSDRWVYCFQSPKK